MAGGKEAVASGQKLEKDFQNFMSDVGFKVLKYKEYDPVKNHEVLIRNVPYTTIYGMKGTSEYCLRSKRYGINCRIECKEQNVGGSVDEKLPYLLANCLESFPEKNIIIIHRGNGFKKGAIPWLKRKAQENSSIKNILILNWVEFKIHMNKILKP